MINKTNDVAGYGAYARGLVRGLIRIDGHASDPEQSIYGYDC